MERLFEVTSIRNRLTIKFFYLWKTVNLYLFSYENLKARGKENEIEELRIFSCE